MVAALAPLIEIDPTLGIVAPEALSRLYRRGAKGEEIGASWMTRHDRLHEIEDYLLYLDAVEREMIGESERLVVLGFSQGAATAARWSHHRVGRVAQLVAWGGALPPEIAGDTAQLRTMPPTILVHGVRDPLVQQSALAEQQRLLRECGVEAELLLHKGAHAVTAEALAALAPLLGLGGENA